MRKFVQMSRQEMATVHIRSIAQQHRLLGLAKPAHPLFSLLRFEDFPDIEAGQRTKLISDLYQVTLKKDCPCKAQYGQTPYDFDEGVMSFFSPGQVNIVDKGNLIPPSGYLLLIHPDLLRGYPLAAKIRTCGFFDYAVSEALILSDEEQRSVETLLAQIEKETKLPIDRFSQELIVAAIDLLLTYCDRYYNRQFITRKPRNNDLLAGFEQLLNDHFAQDAGGLPTVKAIASQLHLSPKYLSDCLKQLTGQTAQQLIHDKLIEHAKDILAATELPASEIAYRLGFEYPQSFSKLFKAKTQLSPLEFRQRFNEPC